MKYTGSIEGRTTRGNWRYLEELKLLSRKNRKRATKSENRLWYEFLCKRPLGFKFLRQKPIGRFIADFYCSKVLLIIEIDGGSHTGRKNYDCGRDLMMEQRGIKTIRFSNTRIVEDLENVKLEIENVLKASLNQGR